MGCSRSIRVSICWRNFPCLSIFPFCQWAIGHVVSPFIPKQVNFMATGCQFILISCQWSSQKPQKDVLRYQRSERCNLAGLHVTTNIGRCNLAGLHDTTNIGRCNLAGLPATTSIGRCNLASLCATNSIGRCNLTGLHATVSVRRRNRTSLQRLLVKPWRKFCKSFPHKAIGEANLHQGYIERWNC